MRVQSFVALTLVSALALAAEDRPAGTGSITETFRCTFNDGQGVNDLWSAAEAFDKALDTLDSDAADDYFAAVLLPLRASMPGDYAWIGYWPSLEVMGRGLAAYYASEQGQTADQRFAQVADCESNTWFRTPLLDNFPDDDASPERDAVELYTCSLNEGVALADAAGAEQGYVEANGDAAIAVDRWTPFLANTPFDVVYLVAHEDVESFAAFNSRWLSSDAGQRNQSAFAEVMDCESGLFTGRVLRPGMLANEG